MKPQLAALGLVLCAQACDPTYGVPASACDDHCHALQRANCNEDDPADCVRECERTDDGRGHTRCSSAWSALDDCFLHAASSNFFCADDHSQTSDICLAERRALSECLTPGSGACFDQCLRQVSNCGAALPDCEARCRQPASGCELTFSRYYSCLLDYPVECPSPGPDTRAAQDIPCFDEALDVLECSR